MRALQLMEHGSPGRLELRQLPEPSPADGEVVVRVQACGLNHLDLWFEENALPLNVPLPRTPGCEPAGVVEVVGAQVTDWKPGDRVAVQSNLFCGECEFCQRGEESLCLRGKLLGVEQDGGFAELLCVPCRSLVRLPAEVDYRAAAGLTLAGSTAMHMLTDRFRVERGQWVLVVGAASGVGSAGIQIARHLGARVITTGRTEARRELGLRLGAEQVIDPGQPDWPATVRRLTDRRGVDCVLEHVGGKVLLQCLQCLARGGTLLTCGATLDREILMDLWPFFVKQQRLVGSYGRNRKDMAATLSAAAAGWLQPVLEAAHPLEQGPEAYAALRQGRVLGKRLLLPTPGYP